VPVVLAVLLSLAILGSAPEAEAQPPKSARIGVIGEATPGDPFFEAFRQGLRELGYVEGQNVLIEYRNLAGVVERAPALAAELVSLQVNVLVVGGAVAAQAARAAAPSVPIVFAQVGDPVAAGLVASLARPGGNVTGLSNLAPGLGSKQLELLKAAVPKVSRVSVLYNPLNRVAVSALESVRDAARVLRVELQVLEVRQRGEVAGAFSTLTAWRAEAVVAISDPVFGDVAQLAKLAAVHRLPSTYSRREFAEAGGLLAYGPSFADNYRRAATYVDRILKGARPADLPVEQPTRFELVINLKTARALGITVPPPLLGRADQVIQ